jgi:hypothetical protein
MVVKAKSSSAALGLGHPEGVGDSGLVTETKLSRAPQGWLYWSCFKPSGTGNRDEAVSSHLGLGQI